MKRYLTENDIIGLYGFYGTPGLVIRHCKGVTECAMRVARALNEHGFSLDLKLIYGAGMVHDMARAFDKHWDVGADKLEELGFPEEAHIVREHMLYQEYNTIDNIDELDIICIGDRLVKDGTYVGIDERFEYIADKITRRMGPGHEKHVRRSKDLLKAILDEIEKVIGKSVDELYAEEFKERFAAEKMLIDKDSAEKMRELVKKAGPQASDCLEECLRSAEEIEMIKDPVKGEIKETADSVFEITHIGPRSESRCSTCAISGSCILKETLLLARPSAMVKSVSGNENVLRLSEGGAAGKEHVTFIDEKAFADLQKECSQSTGKLPCVSGSCVVTKGLDYAGLKPGDALRMGGAAVEVTEACERCGSGFEKDKCPSEVSAVQTVTVISGEVVPGVKTEII